MKYKIKKLTIFSIIMLICTFLGNTNANADILRGIDTGLKGDDNGSNFFPIGFKFQYWGTEYTNFSVSTNGWINLSKKAVGNPYSNPDFPMIDGLDGLIAPFFDDIRMDVSGQPDGQIFYLTVGDEPNRILIIQYNDVYFYGSDLPMGTFEILFFEKSNEIKYQYRYLRDIRSFGNSATIGIDNPNNEEFIRYTFDSYSLEEQFAIIFIPDENDSYIMNKNVEYSWIDISGLTNLPPTDGGEYASSNIQFSWSTIEGAIDYRIDIATSPNESDIIATYALGNINSFTYSFNLEEGTTYYARVAASIHGGSVYQNPSNFSDGITIDLTSPTIVKPLVQSGNEDLTVQFTFNGEDNFIITNYHIQVDTDSSFKSPIIDEIISKDSFYYIGKPGEKVYARAKAIDGAGNESNFSSPSDPITVNHIADFTADITSGNAPLLIHFMDNSPGFPISWEWDFDNDGEIDSTQQNPFYTYKNEGTYSVKLLVKNKELSYQITKEKYIVVSGPLPDIIIDNINTPDIAWSGETINIQWVVKNIGHSDTNTSWNDRIFISSIPEFHDQNVHSLGDVQNVGYLLMGESYLNFASFTLKEDIQEGIYYVLISTDYFGKLNENDENNNIGISDQINVKNTPPPDLQVLSFIHPKESFSGQSIKIKWNVINKGDSSTKIKFWWDKIYISSDSEFNIENAIFIDKFRHNGILSADESYEVTSTIHLPENIYGNYYIYIFTDSDNEVYENIFESNNFFRNEQALSITLYPPPDLAIEELISLDKAFSGEILNFQYIVKNKGAGKTMKSYWADSIYLGETLEFDPISSTKLATNYQEVSLLPDDTYLESINISVPEGIEGEFYLYINIDDDNDIFEHTFEDNNIVSKKINISLSPSPDLNINSIDISQKNFNAGDKIVLTYDVVNIGEIAIPNKDWIDNTFISVDSEWSGSGISLKKSKFLLPLLPNETYKQSTVISLPFNLSGTYYLYIHTDYNNDIYEHSGENNNISRSFALNILPYPPVDLAVDKLKVPSSCVSGSAINIEWEVRNISDVQTLSSIWFDRIFLSIDAELNENEDFLLKSVNHIGMLDSEQGYTRTAKVIIPKGLTGNCYIFVKADAGNITKDTFFPNNILHSSVKIDLPGLYDFIVDSIDTTSVCISAQPLTITWTVRNNGDFISDDLVWYDAISLSVE